MVTPIKIPISSSELGTLWTTYQRKKMMKMLINHFVDKSENEESKKILFDFTKETEIHISEIENIFSNEKAICPIAFDDNDIFKDAPPLFEDMFSIIFLRLLMKMDMGANAINLSMAYRNDIREFYKRSSIYSQDIFDLCTGFLLERGILARPPYVTMPKRTEFVEEKRYMSGLNLIGEKRALNTIEVGFLVHALEANIFGMQLMTGFAQVATESEVRKYFIKGKELSKKIITQFNSVLLQSDLPAKLLFVEKDILSYANEGGKLMIKHGWRSLHKWMTGMNLLSQRNRKVAHTFKLRGGLLFLVKL